DGRLFLALGIDDPHTHRSTGDVDGGELAVTRGVIESLLRGLLRGRELGSALRGVPDEQQDGEERRTARGDPGRHAPSLCARPRGGNTTPEEVRDFSPARWRPCRP